MTSETHTDSIQDTFWLGDWQVFASRQTICRDHKEVRLEPKVLAVLMMLADNYPHVVSKTSLLDTVWSGRFVVPGVLKRCISELRRALGDNAKEPRYIATVPTSGYRLVAKVNRIAKQEEAAVNISDRVPYRGLAAFTIEDAPIYFGREDAITDVLDAISGQVKAGRSFCLITGPSGSGKSSLAQAGVMPALMAQETDRRWRQGVFRLSDGRDLFRHFADTLLTALGKHRQDGLRAQGLAVRLKEQPEEAINWLMHELEGETPVTLLVLLDQLEELFAPGVIENEILEAFFALLYQLCRTGNIWILATIRNDFYPRALAFESLRNLIRPQGLIEIRPPGSAQIGRMIREPARYCGVRFERSADGVALDDLLQNAASGRPDLLPLLQFALLELYNQRSDNNVLLRATFDQLGGLEGCVAQRAESVFNALPPQVRHRLPDALVQLVRHTPEGSTLSRQSVSMETLANDADTLELVEAFINARLFSTRLIQPGDTRYVQVTHEALLRNWPRARKWLQDNAELVNTRTWLAEQSQRWRAEGASEDYLLPSGKPLQRALSLVNAGVYISNEDQQLIHNSQRRANRVKRLKQALVATISTLAVIAVVAAFIANRQRHSAIAEAAKAAQATQFMTELFAAADPGRSGGKNISASEILDRGSERVRTQLQAQPQLSASLMYAMGEAYRGLGLYPQATEMLHDALQMHQLARTATTPDAAHTHNALAAVLREQGDFEAAGHQLSQALAIVDEQDDSALAAYADSLDEFSMLRFLERKGSEAKIYAQKALQIRQRFQNNNHVDIANSWSNRGAANASLGEDSEAEAAFLEALRIYRARNNQDKVKMAITLNNLGSLAYKREDLKNAQEFFEQALALRTAIYGEEHPDSASMATNLASVLRDMGHTTEAMVLIRDAYRVLLDTISARHPTTALTAIKMCELQLATNSRVNIDGDLLPAVSTMEELYGSDSWLAARARSVLGAALFARGDVKSAEPLLRESTQTLMQILGADSKYVQDAQTRLRQIN